MISTATAAVNAFEALPSKYNQPASVSALMINTVGTKILLTLSANFCTGALVACASRTNLAMRANVVSAPTRVARTTMRPFIFTVADVTESPTTTSTGTLSPVTMLISMLEAPSATTPSAASFSPGLTTTMSPSRTTDAGIDTSTPSRNTVAYFAPNANNDRNASPAECFARISKKRPTKMNDVTVAPTSKYTCDELDCVIVIPA